MCTSDKNLGPVIMERNTYIHKCLHDHLLCPRTYVRLTEEEALQNIQHTRRILNETRLHHRDDLSVAENIVMGREVGGLLSRVPWAQIIADARRYMDMLGVSIDVQRPMRGLSIANQQMVEIARALALQPAFLLLDEPAAGMNHDETDDLRRVLTHIRDELGLGIIIVEHDLNLILSLCDKVVVLDRGLMIAAGTPAEVRSDPAVIKAYIGTADQGGEGAAHA